MWAQEQIFVSGNIFRLWRKYILYCFKNPDKLPDHSYTHKTSLHPIWHHFIDPLTTIIISSFWSAEVFVKQVPFCLGHLAWAFYSIFIWPNYPALPNLRPSWYSMWVHHPNLISGHFSSCKATILNLGPNLLKCYQDVSPSLPQPPRHLVWTIAHPCCAAVHDQVYCSKLQRVISFLPECF